MELTAWFPKKTYTRIEEVVQYAARRKLNEVEFLKLKPSGRARENYAEYALSQDMIRAFYPMIVELSRKYQTELKIDCSFIPAMVWHRPPKNDLEKLAVTGCDGGNLLMSIRANGTFSGCSFVENHESVRDIAKRWHSSLHLQAFRRLTEDPQEPCASCEYLSICRCGCRAVALHYTGTFATPDPERPFVWEFQKK